MNAHSIHTHDFGMTRTGEIRIGRQNHKPPVIDTAQRRFAMKLFMFGMLFMVDAAAIGVLEQQPGVTFYSALLTSLISGSVGMAVNLALFGIDAKKLDENGKLIPDTHVGQRLSQHIVASVFLPGLFAPVAIFSFSSTFHPDVNFLMAAANAIAGAMGLGGPYFVRKFGKDIADGIAVWSLKKMKENLPGA